MNSERNSECEKCSTEYGELEKDYSFNLDKRKAFVRKEFYYLKYCILCAWHVMVLQTCHGRDMVLI